MQLSIAVVSPGDVAYYALGATGFVIVIIAGWTTANPNLYRAGLAAQAVFPSIPRQKVTLAVGAVVVVGSSFPFIYRQILPILAYAGLVLVPIGGIVFAEQHIFPRLGYKTNWHRLKGVKDNKPALMTWAICLVFGFGLDAIGIMPFVYLFLPTWAVAIVSYTLLAKAAGADKSHPEAEQREQEFDRRVKEYHARLAAQENQARLKDTTVLTKGIRAVWILIGLVVPAVLAWRVLFNSPDLYEYYVNREVFYDLTIWCTLIYFVFAWWDLQRSKSLQRAARPRVAASPAE